MGLLLALFLFQALPQFPIRDSRPDPPPPAGTATVSGRVTTADTGLPVRRAIVRLGAVDAKSPETVSGNAGYGRSVFTDVDGRFQFTELPAGSYALAATPGSTLAGYLGAGYGVTGAERWQPIPLSRRMNLADGQSLHVDLALPRAAAITGRVVDGSGQPVARVSVTAMRVVANERSGGSTALTDDLGHYRVFGLVPAEYVVFVTSARSASAPVLTAPEQDAVGIVLTYAPGVPSLTRAARVRLGPGGEASLDVQVLEARLATISGTALTSAGEPFKGSFSLEHAELRIGGVSGGLWMSAAGEFKFERVTPGTYDVVVRHLGKGLIPLEVGIARVEVMGGDVENLMIVTKPPTAIQGEIVYDDGVSDGRHAAISIAAAAQPRGVGAPPTVAVTGATFIVRQIFEPFLLRGTATDPHEELSLKAVLLNGKDITDEPRLLSEKDGRLQVVFTSKAPAIGGTVTDENGAPVEDVFVVLFSEDESSWLPNSSRVRIARPGKGGVFALKGLREGQYRIVAIPSDYRFTLSAPEVELRELTKVATPVVVTQGDSRTVDLRLYRPGQ